MGTQRMLTMSASEKKDAMRSHFIRILQWLLNEKCFILTMENEANESPKFMLCHRSFLHKLRGNLILDFVLKKYDSRYAKMCNVVLNRSLFILRRDWKHSLKPTWHRLSDRERRQQMIGKGMAPINNRFAIGRLPTANNDESPFGVSLDEIVRGAGNCNAAEECRQHLDVLCDGNHLASELADVCPILLRPDSDCHCVNVCGIMNVLRLEDVRECVHCRFDELEDGKKIMRQSHDAMRIFSALCSMHKVGDKQLSELCVIKQATTKQILFRMLAEKYVKMEYIPRSSDRDPKRSVFVWSINWNNLHKKILQSMYNGIANLMIKRRSLRKKIEQCGQANNPQLKQKLCAAFEHLTLTMQKIDLQIALHRDF